MSSDFVDISRIVNASILQEIPEAFYEATGISPGIHDLNGELVTVTPRGSFCDFCRIMYFSPQGHKHCRKSNICGARRAFQLRTPHIYHCHANLVDVSAPIIVNGHHAGAVTCGQVLLEPLTDAYRERVQRRLIDFPVEMQRKLMKALESVRVVPLRRLRGVAQLLFAVANNIVDLANRNIQEKELNVHNVRAIDEMRTRALLEQEIKNAQLNLKDAELQALQAQINPHFLYNTLDSIQWLAALHGVEDIRQAVYALGQLLRHSLDRRSEVVTIRREIEQVRNYLSIQKLRYQEKLSIRINVEEEVMDFLVPKLVLQPLVENAILHGVEPSLTGGTVWIDGWLKSEDEAVLEVIDDGVGIPAELQERITGALADSGSKESFLGLLNVHQRLIHFIGKSYGLQLMANRDGRTCARMSIRRMPKVSVNENGQALDSSSGGR